MNLSDQEAEIADIIGNLERCHQHLERACTSRALDGAAFGYEGSVKYKAAVVEMRDPIVKAREFIKTVMHEGERDKLKVIFGDCTRLAKIQAATESVQKLLPGSELASTVEDCLNECKTVQHLLAELNLEGAWSKALDEARRKCKEFEEESNAARRSSVGGSDGGYGGQAVASVSDGGYGGAKQPLKRLETIAPTAAAAAESTLALKVSVLSASALGPPAYRFGDITVNAVQHLTGSEMLKSRVDLSQVYVELQFGDESRSTYEVDAAEDKKVTWENEDHYFLWDGAHREMVITVRDRKGVQQLTWGDPTVGSGTVAVEEGFADGSSRLKKVILARESSTNAGTIEIELRVEPTSGLSAEAWNSSKGLTWKRFAGRGDGDEKYKFGDVSRSITRTLSSGVKRMFGSGPNTWSEGQLLRLCSYSASAPLLLDPQKYRSVSATVEALNIDGADVAPEGFCVVYSATKGEYYMLYRSDRLENAEGKKRWTLEQSELLCADDAVSNQFTSGASRFKSIESGLEALGGAGTQGLGKSGYCVVLSQADATYYLLHRTDMAPFMAKFKQ